jgi:membrane protease subunit HflK
MLTHDADIVDVRFAVQYQVRKPADYLFRSADPDLTVTQAAQAAVRQIVGTRSMNDIVSRDREAIRARLAESIQHSLDELHTGLAVTGVTIQSAQVPDQVQAAFEDAAKAHQDRERAKRDARAYANELLPRAQAEAARMIDDAKTYSDRVVAQADGDAERFKEVYAQYSKAPAVIRERMYLETMQQIYSNTTKVFVDSKSGSNVLYLPLDKLVEQTRQRAAEAAAASSAAAPQAAPAAASAQNAQPAAQGANAGSNAGANTPTIVAPPAAPVSSASQAAAASDAFRSRDSFRSRGREDDLQ